MHAKELACLAGLLLIATIAPADTLSGRWVEVDDDSISLSLEETPDGAVQGTLGGEPRMRVMGRRAGGVLNGTLELEPGVGLPVRLEAKGERLEFCVIAPDGGCTHFRREREPAAPPNAAKLSPATPSPRSVVINAKQLSSADLARIERAHGLRIPAANYWYDPACGAWGAQGGPTAGFLAPALPLGGPLRADASGGGTGVFINGREAHALDVAALAQLLGSPILPARYFLSGEGFAGFEGGPPLWNLIAIASANAGGGGGSSNSWSSRLSSGFSDGETGAVFLPNGGIVSYGN